MKQKELIIPLRLNCNYDKGNFSGRQFLSAKSIGRKTI